MIDCALVYSTPSLDSPAKGPALSIFYPGVVLEKSGFEVEYSDERFDNRQHTEKLIKNSLVIGVSSMTGFQLGEAQRILKTAKEINPNIITLLGGVHPSMLPDQCIRESFIDVVCVGEGERTLLEFMKCIKKKKSLKNVKGILWKNNGNIIKNEKRELVDINKIPWPVTKKNRHYFKIAADASQIRLLSSRGCPHKCRFCYNQIFNRSTWRPMNIKKLENELDAYISEFKIKKIILGDDNIGPVKERIKKICGLMEERGITWHTGIRCEYITDEIAQTLDKSGCSSLFFGVESGSNRILNEIIGKGYPGGVENIKNCARIMSKTNITGMYSFMCGLPTETIKELIMSMELADWIKETDKNARISFYVYAPYPGTSLYKEAIEQGFQEPCTIDEWTRITLSSERNPKMENLYYISGLNFRKDKTGQNFPGLKRFSIKPFELSASLRWKTRITGFYWEKRIIKYLLAKASKGD